MNHLKRETHVCTCWKDVPLLTQNNITAYKSITSALWKMSVNCHGIRGQSHHL